MALTALLALAACLAPREACLNEVSRDLRVVRGLIDDTQATLDRGYAIRTETRLVQYQEFCFRHGKKNGRGHFTFCDRIQAVTSREPVAVDLDAERRKLNSLKRKERDLIARTQANIESCKKAYPEG